MIQHHRPVEHRRPRLRVDAIRDEVAVPLELERSFGRGILQCGLQLRADHFHRIGVEVVEEVARLGAGLRGLNIKGSRRELNSRNVHQI